MAWDDLLMLLSGQWSERASSLEAGLGRIGLRNTTALGAVHVSHSLFAQLSRGGNGSAQRTGALVWSLRLPARRPSVNCDTQA